MTTAEILLAFSGFALQAISLVVMVFKKTYKLFSWFFVYLCTNCAFTVALSHPSGPRAAVLHPLLDG